MKCLLFFLCLGLSLQAEIPFEKIQDDSTLTINTPSLAGRQTAKLRLSNGLEAYLISDPKVEQSAAALAVNVGSWHDPKEYPGMAHFLEHMLFMGTQSYPDEHEFMQYISDNGGKVNAFTASDRTVYMFSVNNEGFDEALNRLAHFFIDPLFKTASIERELHAVDQEYAKNIENDGWRQYMIFKETGNPSHPNAKFSTGNADTLRDIPQEAMKKWYKENYTAGEMHLVVLSNHSIEDLIQQTVADFSAVENRAAPQKSFPTSMTSDAQKGHIIYVKPVKDLKILSIIWELPKELACDNEMHAGDVLAYILKNGGKNSLLGLLKREHLADDINVYQDKLTNENRNFTLDLSLTDKGVEKITQVISFCFENLARLKKTGVPEYIFNEVVEIQKLKYMYQSRQDAFEYVHKVANLLVDEKIETFPQKSFVPSKYDAEFFQKYISFLTPENCIYFVLADPQKTGVPMTHKEKWMDAEYAIHSPLKKQINLWANAPINPQIGLPLPNPYIPKNLELVSDGLSDEAPTPTLIEDEPGAKIYFATDNKYHVPEVTHFFKLKSPLLQGTAKSKTLSDLYMKALEDQLFSPLSAAETAGFKTEFKQENFSIKIALNGYSDTSDRLVEEIFKGMRRLHPSKDEFHIYKQALLSKYENASKELPFLQSMEVLANILFNNAPTSGEKLQELKNIQYEDFLKFSNNLFKSSYIEGLLYGNLNKENAKRLLTKIHQKFKTSPYLEIDQLNRQIFILPEGEGPYMVMESTTMLGNAALLAVEQGPYTLEKKASQQVLGKVLKDGFFDTLRTKQQTAYIAKAFEKEEEGQLLQFFVVQSSTHQPGDLIARFELFLEDFLKQYTTQLPPARFENIRKMCIASLQMPPENQVAMGVRLATLAFDYHGEFDLIDKRIGALEKLTYDQVRNDANLFFSRQNTRRIATLIEGTLPKDKDFRYNLTNKQDLHHKGEFVAWK